MRLKEIKLKKHIEAQELVPMLVKQVPLIKFESEKYKSAILLFNLSGVLLSCYFVGDDAVKAAEVLKLELKTLIHNSTEIKYVEFMYDGIAYESYLTALIKTGYRVAVVEDLYE